MQEQVSEHTENTDTVKTDIFPHIAYATFERQLTSETITSYSTLSEECGFSESLSRAHETSRLRKNIACLCPDLKIHIQSR